MLIVAKDLCDFFNCSNTAVFISKEFIKNKKQIIEVEHMLSMWKPRFGPLHHLVPEAPSYI